MSAPTIFFDLDGVLVDSRIGIIKCLNRVIAEMGFVPFDSRDLERVIGPPLYEGFRTLIKERGGDLTRLDWCVMRYRELYATAALDGGTILQAGIASVLEELQADFVLAVATSKPVRFAEPILESLGVRKAFVVVVGPSSGTDGETKTQTLRRAIDAVGAIDRSRTWMVGDRYHDVTAALANQIVPIGVTWGFGTEEELRQAGTSLVVGDPSALLAFFRTVGFAT
jgi:phosphoglycolate phosphatase